MNPKLDVNVARIVHLTWEMELEARTVDQEGLRQLPSHRDCELGQWLHGRGQRQIDNRELLVHLFECHMAFHQSAEEVLSLLALDPALTKGKVQLAMINVRKYSREIVTLLTQAELESLGEELVWPHKDQPIPGFLSRLFKGPHTPVSEKEGVLEINHSRLVHLRWANHLPETFRHRGRHVSLEPAELCALGVWIHGTGLQRFGHMPEMALLDTAHQAFHKRSEEVLRSLRKHRDQIAERAYQDVQNLSQEIIYLLSIIEFRLFGDASIQRSTSIID